LIFSILSSLDIFIKTSFIDSLKDGGTGCQSTCPFPIFKLSRNKKVATTQAG